MDIPETWPKEGPDFNRWNKDAAGFVALMQAHDTFWLCDHQLKYLTLRIDTRDCGFIISDRDGNTIEPERVLRAISRWNEKYPLAERRAAGTEERG